MSREDRIKLYKKIYHNYIKYGKGADSLPQDEIDRGIEAGFLLNDFEHFTSHDEAIVSAKERIAVIDKNEIAEAFLYSLSTSLCEYRSPLLSYYYLLSICPHEIEDYFYHNGKKIKTAYCNICLYYNNQESPEKAFDLVTYVLIQKYLFGTVSAFSYYFDWCMMDITQYLTLPKLMSSKRDKEIFIESLNLIKTLNGADKAGAYIKRLYETKIIPNATKAQIAAYVDTLGSLNILHHDGDYAMTKGRGKYESSYRDPSEHKNDHPFPLTHWRAADGVDWNEVQAIFNINTP
jgi:hypothetical protein